MPILESIDVHKLIGYGSLVEHNLGTTLDVKILIQNRTEFYYIYLYFGSEMWK